MIERSNQTQKHDRLAAFLKTYGLQAQHTEQADKANLFILDTEGAGTPTHLLYAPRSAGASLPDATVLSAAVIDFNGIINPLINTLPDLLSFDLSTEPHLRGLSDLIVTESLERRCGGGTIFARLCEVVVVLAIRKAIAAGTVNAGLLAGLAHTELHVSLIAMHENPARDWQISELAQSAGMKRGAFIATFKRVVGQPPATYLTQWRLSLARVQLRAGRSVKSVSTDVGFGSAAAFLRAFSRVYGYAPRFETDTIE
jgi:AraC-like DNA-binding protein